MPFGFSQVKPEVVIVGGATMLQVAFVLSSRTHIAMYSRLPTVVLDENPTAEVVSVPPVVNTLEALPPSRDCTIVAAIASFETIKQSIISFLIA